MRILATADPNAIRLPQKNEAQATSIAPGMIQRLVQGVRYIVSGVDISNDYFGPGQPLAPVAQDAARGRQWDFPVAFNTRTTPRAEEPVTFAQMRALADGYDLLKIVMQTRKDQLCAQKFSVRMRDEKVQREPICDEIEEFLQAPDREHTWNIWLRMLLDDLFVIDAPTICPRMNRGGKLYALDLIDGATIKRVLDSQGRTPLPPDPAYQQIIKGSPAVDYSRDELIYMPANPRVSRVYGNSPVEQIITTVNIGIRRQIHQLQFYTEGNIPEMMVGVPSEWAPDQIAQFQTWWDSMLEGNTAQRRHAKFIPGDVKPLLTKEGALKDEYDDWLARVVCYAFSVSPTPFIKQVNRATAETAQDTAKAEGLQPLMQWVQDLINGVIRRHWQRADVCFDWQREENVDPLTDAQVAQIYVEAQIMHPDEIRADLGLDPLTPKQKEELTPAPPVIAEAKPVNGKPGPPPPDKSKAHVAGALSKKKLLRPSTGIARRWQGRAVGSTNY